MKSVHGDGASPSGDDFLARERAALGEDAGQFATSGDAAAFGELPADDDLLGGGDAETSKFESQFPDISSNQVSRVPGSCVNQFTKLISRA